jgi:uncharacterized membrane protein YozB (DUF420 family)
MISQGGEKLTGLLGTSASLWSDLSLITVVVLAGLATFGAIRAKQKRFSTHCPVMAVAALANWIPVLLLMIPRWLNVIQRSESVVSGALVSMPILHGVLGLIAQPLMTYTVVRMYWMKHLPPAQPIWLMRIALGLWMLTALGGVAVYVLYVVGF